MSADDPLRKRLAALSVPEIDPVTRGRALDAALQELRASRPSSPAARHQPISFRWGHRWVLAAGAAAIALLVASLVTLTVRQATDEPLPTPAAERTLLSQMENLFGPQLDAVIENPDGAPDIRLAANPTGRVPPSLAQPVLVLFHPPAGGTVRVLSYSGRTVCVTLDDRRVCFEPLATGEGKVILSGPTFCWTPAHPDTGLRGYRVTARLLPHS